MNTFPLKVYAGKNVFITGDTGFKGSWLAIWLLKLGAKVTGFGLPPKNLEDNFNVTDLTSKIHHIEGDIRDFNAVSQAISLTKPDIVFHLAAQALVLDSYRDPYQTFETNVTGTLNVLEAIRTIPGIQASVMVTSDKCYENRDRVYAYRESDSLGGRDPYSASKGAAEIVISSYTRSFFNKKGTPAIASVRAGNVIGGGDWSENRIVPDCIRALKNNEELCLRNPHAIRPWQHVLDPLHGYLTLGGALLSDREKFSGSWNFGPYHQNAISVESLVREIISQWGSGRYRVDPVVTWKEESDFLMLDISKAIHFLGWRPRLSLKNAIKYTLNEYRIGGLTQDEVYSHRLQHIDDYLNVVPAL